METLIPFSANSEGFPDASSSALDDADRAGAGKANRLPQLCSVKFLIFGVILLACCAATLMGCAGKATVQVGDYETLVRELETRSYLVDRFKAQFEKTRRSSVFSRDMTVQGSLVYEKPDKFHLALTGDVNVEILSDGETITVIHDHGDEETYRVRGERDLSRFMDPLMTLLQGIGRGGLRKFYRVDSGDPNSIILESKPNGRIYFERAKKVMLKVSPSGDIEKVALLFSDGNRDETVFRSWAALAQDDPDILRLNSRLRSFSARHAPGSQDTASGTKIPCIPKEIAANSKG